MLGKRKMIQIAVAVAAIAFYAISERFGERPENRQAEETGIQWNRTEPADSNDLLLQAISSQRSDVQVRGRGEVVKVLPDDTRGSQHQRFLLKVSGNDVILIAHNIDLAPRIPGLSKGDQVGFNGEFEWNDKGGVVHWTHKDPRNRHVHGWLEHNGNKYW